MRSSSRLYAFWSLRIKRVPGDVTIGLRYAEALAATGQTQAARAIAQRYEASGTAAEQVQRFLDGLEE
jgi:hypothetical protein